MLVIPLSEKKVGDIIRISEDGVPAEFVIVHKGLPSSRYSETCNGIWVRRKDCCEKREFDGSYSAGWKNSYSSSKINTWLTGTYYSKISIRSYIKASKIPYHSSNGDAGSDKTGNDGLLCRVFLLSGRELGLTGTVTLYSDNKALDYKANDGDVLDYYKDVDQHQEKLIANFEQTPSSWYTRSPAYSTGEVVRFGADGTPGYCRAYVNIGICPAFILDGESLWVDENGLVTASKNVTSASVTLEEPLDADDEILAACLDADGSIPEDTVLEVLVTNNARDDEPVWEDATAAVRAGKNFLFINRTAANGFAFNFKFTVSRGEQNQSGFLRSVGGAFE